jgi:hypothetical protein
MMVDLNTLTYEEFFPFLTSEMQALSFAQQLEMIPYQRRCVCGTHMKIREKLDVKNRGFYFRCPSSLCRKEVSVRKNTFFEKSHLQISTILMLIYFFIRDNQKQDYLQLQLKRCLLIQ